MHYRHKWWWMHMYMIIAYYWLWFQNSKLQITMCYVHSHCVLTEFGLGDSWQWLDEHSKLDGFCHRRLRHNYICLYVTGCCTGTLDELVGPFTKLAIYPTLTIHCQRVVISASLNTGFKGMQVVTYLANIKQLKSHWLKVPQKGLGTCIWINETHSSF